MSAEVLLNTASAKVLYRTDSKIVHHEFFTPVRGNAFREALLTGLEAMKKRGGCKWLSDDRKNASLWPDDENWARTVWFPQVVKAGWKYWAIVMPERLAAKWNMERHAAHYRPFGIVAKTFSDPDAALKWLENAENEPVDD
jgi:hypothetical protein